MDLERTTLGDLVASATRGTFVGRADERALLSQALRAEHWPFNILYVWGEAGIGKTTLVERFALQCESACVPVLRLDAAMSGASVEGLESLLAQIVGSPLGPPPPHRSAPLERSGRWVLWLDNYETVAGLESWLLDSILRKLPSECLVCMSSRLRPSSRLSGSGWSGVTHVMQLGNLSEQDVAAYLDLIGAPRRLLPSLMRLTHGHPLALSLAARDVDASLQIQESPGEARGVVHHLAQRFLSDVASNEQRTALELSAVLRVTTRDDLAAFVPSGDAGALFDWLARLSFVDTTSTGLELHGIVRNILIAHLRWSSPERYATMLERIVHRHGARRHALSEGESLQLLWIWVQLGLVDPLVGSVLDIEGRERFSVDRLGSDDPAALESMTLEREGAQALKRVRHWIARRPECFLIARDEQGRACAYDLMLPVHELTAADTASDEVAAAIAAHFENEVRRTPYDRATLSRYWTSDDAFQGRTGATTVLLMHTLARGSTEPNLVYNYAVCGRPEVWDAAYRLSKAYPLDAFGHRADNRDYAVYGRDLRAYPLVETLGRLAASYRERVRPPSDIASAVPACSTLTREQFTPTVVKALKEWNRLEVQRDPLLDVLLSEQFGAESLREQRVQLFKQSLVQGLERLEEDAARAAWARAVYRAYISRSGTLRAAATRAGVGYSTFRRHLQQGTDALCEVLWTAYSGDLRLDSGADDE